MTYDFFPDPNIELSNSLNQEIDGLYEEVEALHGETGILMGLMAGSFAFFIKQLMAAHQSKSPLEPHHCEQMVIDALRRVVSTQHRFDMDLVSEIRATLKKMNAAESLQPYLDKAIAQYENQSNR